MVLPSETLASIRTQVARAAGCLEATGTVTSAAAVTGFTSTGLALYASADRLKGHQVVIKSGTGAVANNERLISASSTAGAVTVSPDFGTAPATNDTFDIYRANVADKALLDQAIKHAIELAQDWHMLDHEDLASLVLGSILQNGGMEDWGSGTTSAPTGWTLQEGATPGAAVARESTLILPPFRYSAKLTNEGSQYAALQQQNASLIYPWDSLGGATVSASALVYNTTATRVRLQLTDGVTTWNSTDYHAGAGWEKLTIADKTLASALTELTFQVRIETGAAISIYVHDARLVPGTVTIWEYYLPKKFVRLTELVRETGNGFEWAYPMSTGSWEVDRARERLLLRADLYTPPGEYRVRMVGQAYQAVPSADTDSVELPAAYIVAGALSYLAMIGRFKVEASERAMLHAEAYRLRRTLHRQPAPNSRRVR